MVTCGHLKNETMKDLKNKVAYITGGTKGIGFAVAQTLLGQGMKVVM